MPYPSSSLYPSGTLYPDAPAGAAAITGTLAGTGTAAGNLTTPTFIAAPHGLTIPRIQMRAPSQAVVRAQVLGGQWETIGTDRSSGISVEGLNLTADEWGPSKATFTLKRTPGMPWPDIGAFTPVEVEVGGVLVWSGRVSDTPSQGGRSQQMNVQCEGWQFHLDDDLFTKSYVHTDMSGWRDGGTYIEANLSKWARAGTVTTNAGLLTFGYAGDGTAQSPTWVSDKWCGVMLDQGVSPAGWATKIVVEAQRGAGGPVNVTLFARTSDFQYLPNSNDAIANLNLTSTFAQAPTWTTVGGVFTSPGRYIALFLYNPGADYQATGEDIISVRAIRLFSWPVHEYANASTLKASEVVSDSLVQGTLLLSQDRSALLPTSFNISSFDPGAPVTPRQNWQAVDAYHDWVKQIDVYARPVYSPKPDIPKLEIGTWSGAELSDQSVNAGSDIYNRVTITGTTPDGQPILADRGPQGGRKIAGAQGSQAWSGAGSGAAVEGTNSMFSQGVGTTTFFKGVPYAVRVVSITRTVAGGNLDIRIGAPTMSDSVECGNYSTLSTVPGTFFTWTPTADRTTLGADTIRHAMPDNQTLVVTVEAYSLGSIPDRRAFRRTMVLGVSQPLPSDLTAANIIGDTWIANHRTAQFKGAVSNIGPGAVRDYETGADIMPSRLLLNTMQLVRFAHVVDPDTGGLGRDGMLVGVQYDHATNTVSATIDNTRASFDALMGRLASVQGG